VNEHTPETQPLPRGCQVVDNRDQSRRWWGGGLRPMMGASYLVIDEENTVCGYGGTPSEAVAHYHDRQALRPRIVLRKALAAPSQETPPEREGSPVKPRGMTVLLQRMGTLIRRAFTKKRRNAPDFSQGEISRVCFKPPVCYDSPSSLKLSVRGVPPGSLVDKTKNAKRPEPYRCDENQVAFSLSSSVVPQGMRELTPEQLVARQGISTIRPPLEALAEARNPPDLSVGNVNRQRVPSPAPPVPPSAEKRALVVLSCSYKPQQGREDE
jgi:hypothetical protein